MRRSHLDGAGTSHLAASGAAHRQVFSNREVEERAGGRVFSGLPHGEVVSRDSIRRTTNNAHGGVGNLEGAPQDPRARAYTTRGLPLDAMKWVGSSTVYTNRELPFNDFQGMGFSGSDKIFDESKIRELEGFYLDAPPQVQQKLPPPGPYLMPDGNVMLVGTNQRTKIVTQAQYQQLLQMQAVRPKQGLVARVLGNIRR